MSTKSMFFRLIISELIFFGACILIFVAHLVFWLDEVGIAERVLNIHLPPSSFPIFILGLFYLLAIIVFAVVLSKQIKRLQLSNFTNSKRAFLFSLGCHLLAFSSSILLWIAQDSDTMKTVIPGLITLYFATILIILVAMYFTLFVKTNTNKLVV
ncbi:hypothetical protein [Bacillus sp. ISL-45]|uniref:hypothetical protein n=1 Tax=Bacillus sp. ISL-45 TaxID=2819128 RepID=UPI001BE5F571|nr:hypothetical protein [Bacillus sp. ISL-45]MBT2663402.1 hypothetical protein [Bacillus sp. ISL-45]